MTHAVVWRETALQQLARVWMDSDDRRGVNREVDDIDRTLSTDPDQKGDDYFGDRYILLPQMWALFRIEAEQKQVVVLQVGRNGVDRPHDDAPEDEA